jgi:Ca2+-transporting ATPase
MAEPAAASAWSRSADDVLGELEVDRDAGLGRDEAGARRERHGPNQLREARRRSAWSILLGQFKSVVVLLLVAADVLAIVFGKWPEAIAIAAVIAVNTLIGFFSEWKAVRSMEALRQRDERQARVLRGGEEQEIGVPELVPGDIVLLEAEALVPADLRLLEGEELRVNEAALTGESVAVDKSTDPVDGDAVLPERTSMLYKGTTVVDGRAVGVTVATGMATEIGRIAEMAEEAEATSTPLQQRLDQLGRRLAWITIGIAAVVAAAGLWAGRETLLMIETSIALGVAAIPEGLPIVATIALARGMWLMARRHAIVKRLAAVETLGATRVIFTDKTGTLTENRMTLRRIVTPAGDEELPADEEDDRDEPEGLTRRAIEIGVLCNGASLGENEDERRGDPTEIALLDAGAAAGLRRSEVLDEQPEVREVSFDPDVMMMATFHRAGDRLTVAVKGAPSAVLDVCDRVATEDGGERELDDSDRDEWRERTEGLAAEGLRLLAVADRTANSEDEEPYEHLRLVGLVGLLDPPRRDVEPAIDGCHRAGVRVVMVTGDQPATARAIGEQVGAVTDEDRETVHGRELGPADELGEEAREHLYRAGVFARVSPEQKLDIVTVYQERGEIVAMTGDGVNDAPALKKADIGVAMGRRGTDAAKQVADMVLADDSFASIVAAIEQGRVIFGNIRQSVMFMLCTNVAEVIAVAAASLAQVPLPLRPLQILYLNVITDVLPALALGVSKGAENIMDQPPRAPGESILTRRHWGAIGGWAVLIAACVLTGLWAGLEWLGLERLAAVTVSFLTLAFAKLWFVFNLRPKGSRLFRNEITRNPWIWAALGVCIVLLGLAVYLPGLSDVLETREPSLRAWGLILGLSLVPFIVGQAMRIVQRRKGA